VDARRVNAAELARCHGYDVAAGQARIGAVETPVFAGPTSAPDYLIIRTPETISGTYRVIPAALVADVDRDRRIITLRIDESALAAYPEQLPLRPTARRKGFDAIEAWRTEPGGL